MPAETRKNLRNLAILAHVDHGKTTLADALLWQTALLREHPDLPDALLSAPDPGREKAVRVMPRMLSVEWDNMTYNLLDTPGRADFGGKVRRTLRMVDGILYIVDAREGPSPRNRFVLSEALAAKLAPIVVLSKMDQPGARPEEVLEEIRGVFSDLDASERQLDFPVLYCDALRGICAPEPDTRNGSVRPLLRAISERIPGPPYDPDGPFLMQVADLAYDDFHGRLAVGRVLQGAIEVGQTVYRGVETRERSRGKVGGLCLTRGMGFRETARAEAGDMAAVAGIEGVKIGDTLSAESDPETLPALPVDRSTISVVISTNDSPTAGQDGRHVSAADLRERLWKEILTNPAIHVEEADGGSSFRICGRDELQLAILIEMMRREGYEMLVSRPAVVFEPAVEGADGREPVETLVVDCPEIYSGVVTQKVETRNGRMIRMVNHGTGRCRIEFRIPTRGLIGFRTEFLSDTRGTGIMNHIFHEYLPVAEEEPLARPGVLVADRPGRVTAWAIEHLQSRGTIFVSPGDEVYEGMIVGENSTRQDVQVDISKLRKKGTAGTITSGEERARLIPPRFLSLEQALEFLGEDSVVEVTPRLFRLRKRTLKARQRTGNP